MTTVGIIKADEIDTAIRSRFGDSHSIFQRLFTMANADHLLLQFYDARACLYPKDLDECDGYLITGSRHCAFSDTPWIHQLLQFVRTLDQQQKKLIGICFGHQCIALALGGSVVRAKQGWGLGVHEYQMLLPGLLDGVSRTTVRLYCSHEDQVNSLPERAKRLLTSDFCENAGMVVEDHIISFQAHPEFEKDFAEYLILNREKDLGPNYKPTLETLSSEVDSVPVARSMVRFLEN